MVCSLEMRNNFSILGLLVAMGAIGGGTRLGERDIKAMPRMREPGEKRQRAPRQGDTASHGAIWRGGAPTTDRDKKRVALREVRNRIARHSNYKGWCGDPESGLAHSGPFYGDGY